MQFQARLACTGELRYSTRDPGSGMVFESTIDENDAPSPRGLHAAVPPPAVWPELIVDIGCADIFDRTCPAATSGLPVPVTLDVNALLATGARSVLLNSSAVVIGARAADGSPASEVVQQVRATAPHVGIYALLHRQEDVAHWSPPLHECGVDDVFLEDRPGEVNWTLSHRLAAPPPETEIRLLWRWFRESPERSLILHCVRNAYWVDKWTQRVRVFGATRKTLQNRMIAQHLPSPGLIARCGRMLHAQELERRGVRPMRAIAPKLGFPTAAALQRARRRLRRSLLSRGHETLVFASLLK